VSDDLVESVVDVLFAYVDANKLQDVLAARDARLLRERLESPPKSAPVPVSKSATSVADAMAKLTYEDDFPSVAEDLRRFVESRPLPSGDDEWSKVLARTEEGVRELLDRYSALEDLTTEAATRNLPAQELRVTGRWATIGKLPIDFLEKILHTWRRLYTDIRSSFGEATSPANLFVLAPSRGSFVVRVLVDTEKADFERETKVAEKLEQVAEAIPEGGSAEIRGAAAKWPVDYAPLLKLAADQEVDLEVQLVVPGPTGTRRRIHLSHGRARTVMAAFTSGAPSTSAREEVVGILEGANHRTGKFEMLPEGGGSAIAGSVARQGKSILLDKRIGGSYRFDLSNAGEDKWELHRLWEEGGESTTAPTREVLAPPPNVVTSTYLPQVDSLRRITQVVEVVALGKVLSPDTIDLSKRHIDYHKQAARLLHLLSDDGTLLPAGATLVALPERRRLEHLSIQFEVSVCGHAWILWANASSVDDLDPNSAFDFLRARSNLKPSMVERRGRTLRRWARDLRNRVSRMNEVTQSTEEVSPPRRPTHARRTKTTGRRSRRDR
jgi:hypothetical protein